jgi:hypothetical protein
MTYDVSSPADLPQEQFDTGPLSWVIADIRKRLIRLAKLSEALKQDEESRATSLLHAKIFCTRRMVHCK